MGCERDRGFSALAGTPVGYALKGLNRRNELIVVGLGSKTVTRRGSLVLLGSLGAR
jgi:hypothetical protein